LLAVLEKHEDDVSRCTELLQRVITLEPQNADAHYQLGQNLLSAGQTEEAIQQWKLALQGDPNHAESLYNLARVLRQLNRPEAKQYEERFERVQAERQLLPRVKTLGNLALDAANARDWARAADVFKQALA
jgi:tetratricopeptide (TPR) repeat protein